MDQQPDKLFREKLEGFQKKPLPAVWERVEKNLNKKNSKLLWLKVAAAILLTATVSIFLVITPRNTFNTQIVSKEKEQPRTNKAEKRNTEVLTDSLQPEKVEEAKRAPKVAGRKKSKKKFEQKAQTLGERVKNEPPSAFASDHTVAVIQKPNPETDSKETLPVKKDKAETLTSSDDQAPMAQSIKKKESGVTLIYTVAEVNEKYLDKKALADATAENKKASTLRKLLDKAHDLKHNQDPLGELRQRKNEILALNFKNDKQRSQHR